MGLNGGGGRYKLCHTQKTADSEVHIGQNTPPPPPPEHIKANRYSKLETADPNTEDSQIFSNLYRFS